MFCNLHALLQVNPLIRATQTLTAVALAVYAVYTCTKAMRAQEGCAIEVAVDAMAQSAREGARGHNGAARVLDARWSRPEAASPLSASPASPFSARVHVLLRLRQPKRWERRVRARGAPQQ